MYSLRKISDNLFEAMIVKGELADTEFIAVSDEELWDFKCHKLCWNDDGTALIESGKSAESIAYWTKRATQDEARNEMPWLLEWFSKYDVQVAEYNRAIRLGLKPELHIDNTVYDTITELDTAAMAKAARLKECRRLVAEKLW